MLKYVNYKILQIISNSPLFVNYAKFVNMQIVKKCFFKLYQLLVTYFKNNKTKYSGWKEAPCHYIKPIC